MSQYENSGNLFPASNMKIVRHGKLDVEGADQEVIISQVTTKNNKTVFEVYRKIGAMFINTDDEQDYDASGKIETEHGEYMMWSRKRTDKNNNPFTRASIAPIRDKPESKEGLPQEMGDVHNTDPVDDIPF
tara:strand:- start:62 stop:454 length:393 start_codon:yes stop_codon:yes gene_type:complete